MALCVVVVRNAGCFNHPSSPIRPSCLHSQCTLPFSSLRRPPPSRLNLTMHKTLHVRASTGPDAPQEQSQFGLGGPGTWFGFGKRQERAVGRLAMVGFVAGVVMEVLTGKGILAQLGIDAVAVKYPFLAGLSFLFIGGLLGGFVVINNPPAFDKVPPNEGAGLPRDPLKTYDPQTIDPLTTWTRGKQGQEPYASDLDLPSSGKKE